MKDEACKLFINTNAWYMDKIMELKDAIKNREIKYYS